MSPLERTLSENEKPKWEAAGTYWEAWRMAADMAVRPQEMDPAMTELFVEGLRVAHVVTVSREQAGALPRLSSADTRRHAVHLRPPFPVTYFSLGRVAVEGTDFRCLGALLLDGPDDGWGAYVLAAVEPDLFLPVGYFYVAESVLTAAGGLPLKPFSLDLDDGQREAVPLLAGSILERLVAVLMLLDGTVGVELAPAVVSRQVRRQAERTGASVALTVTIRQSNKTATRSGGNQANYSHRFERRAHFACITRGPHYKEDKLASWCPRHGVKACRREFRRATVVGPADKPLVPKVRHLVSA